MNTVYVKAVPLLTLLIVTVMKKCLKLSRGQL